MKENVFAEYHKSLNPPLKINFWISSLVWTENGSHTWNRQHDIVAFYRSRLRYLHLEEYESRLVIIEQFPVLTSVNAKNIVSKMITTGLLASPFQSVTVHPQMIDTDARSWSFSTVQLAEKPRSSY